MRVTVMHSIARDLYATTANTDFRNRITNSGDIFPFDVVAYESIENESRIVGMVMAWSVVTLESLVNHQLAATLDDDAIAIMAIEYPAQAMKKLQITESPRSDLAKKLSILLNQMQSTNVNHSNVFELAASLADKRNLIVHDKPFRLIDHGDGDFDVQWFRDRGDTDLPLARYEDLAAFYSDCDSVKECVLSANPESLDCDIDFRSLVIG